MERLSHAQLQATSWEKPGPGGDTRRLHFSAACRRSAERQCRIGGCTWRRSAARDSVARAKPGAGRRCPSALKVDRKCGLVAPRPIAERNVRRRNIDRSRFRTRRARRRSARGGSTMPREFCLLAVADQFPIDACRAIVDQFQLLGCRRARVPDCAGRAIPGENAEKSLLDRRITAIKSSDDCRG